MKKAVCIRDWRPAKLKEGNFRGEHDRDHSNTARSQNFIILNPKYIDSQKIPSEMEVAPRYNC